MSKPGNLLQPQYAASFRCIGPECEESCCRGWRVSIDKKTYQKYRNCPDLNLKAKLQKCVTRNRSNPDDYAYARMKLEEGSCPMLDSDKLCILQRTLGEDYLSITCTTYPRFFRTVNGTAEMALTFSCPEAARVGLLNPKTMEFDFTENPYTRTDEGFFAFNPDDSRYKNKAEHYFWPLRIFTISLLQNRGYLLWQRLIILGFFCQDLQNVQKNSEILSVIDRYNRMIEQGIFKAEFDGIPTNYEIQVDLLRQMLMYRLTGDEISAQFVDCFNKAKDLIGLEENTEPELAISNFRAAFESYYYPFMSDHEYIMENYLVNSVFNGIFPFGRNVGIFDNYVFLVVHYAMIKMMLIGQAGFYKEEFGIDHIVQPFYSFVRTIEHHGSYLENVHKLLKENQLDTMVYMSILVRN